MIDIKDYKAITEALAIKKAPAIKEALATAEKTLIKNLAEVDSKIELDINKGSSCTSIVT
jgi:hypothetical protein